MSEPNIVGNIGGASPARSQPNHLRRVLILWAVFSVLGIAFWIVTAQFIFPSSISDLGAFDYFTFLLLCVLAVPVGMFVFVFVGYSLFAFRVKERPTEDGIRLEPSSGLQIGWLGVTSALCLFLIIWGMFAFFQQTTASASNPLVVEVTGQQWTWTFYYPQYGVYSSGQMLELPVNQAVTFTVTSKDVVHGFEIRGLGVRLDANPGQVISIPVVTPTKIGDYSVRCVEFCGLYHAYMWSAVKVVNASDFTAYITSLGGHP